MYADFLYEDPKMTLDDSQKEYLEGLNAARFARVNDLADDLLHLSQVDRRDMSVTSVDLAAFFRELRVSLALSPEVEVVMTDDWPTIDTDPTFLKLIFENLIRNAARFNDSPHTAVELNWLPLGEKLYEVSVRDNGIGIESRYHEFAIRCLPAALDP